MSFSTQTASHTSLLAKEKTISFIKDYFSMQLCKQLSLTKVAAPLFVKAGTGLNDDLNGIEKPVSFKLKGINDNIEIVQSLAKWKRKRLHELEMPAGNGIVTDMRAIRPDEVISPIHSFLVDQWDWEKHITATDRNISYLKETVEAIYQALLATNSRLQEEGIAGLSLPETVHFVYSEELLKQYPGLSPKERENACAKEFGAIFIIGIGCPLSNGQVHDDRAPDYDDWTTTNDDGYTGLNGDLIIWNPALNAALEISSMGIRVDATSLRRQLEAKNCESRTQMEFHSHVLNNIYPLSMGGGIGQSRLCMLLLQLKHIAEVQASIWP